jgi:hypothetical protein
MRVRIPPRQVRHSASMCVSDCPYLYSSTPPQAPTDELDERLDRLAAALAPREVWVDNLRREELKRTAYVGRVLRERGLAPEPPMLPEAEAAADARARAAPKAGAMR